MTEQQERRLFMALADNELEMIVTALLSEAARRNGTASFISYSRLAEVVWQELKQQRAKKPHTGPVRCPHFATSLMDRGVLAIHCEGLRGHDGPHFTGSHLTRREWR